MLLKKYLKDIEIYLENIKAQNSIVANKHIHNSMAKCTSTSCLESLQPSPMADFLSLTLNTVKTSEEALFVLFFNLGHDVSHGQGKQTFATEEADKKKTKVKIV